jgi:Sulfotransferase family
VQPVFVLGAHRSGTSVIGTLIASPPSVTDLGEYYAFYVADQKTRLLGNLSPSQSHRAFLDSLWDHAAEFAGQLTSQDGNRWYLDHTPWNILLADRLATTFPEAVFVLVVRDWKGVCQSLERSYRAGYTWAGPTVEQRLDVWADLYGHVPVLPIDRVAAVSYDCLCRRPEAVLDRLRHALRSLGVPVDWDRRALLDSHAPTAAERRPTLGHLDGGRVLTRPIPSWDVDRWSPAMEQQARARCGTIHEAIETLFPGLLKDGVALATDRSLAGRVGPHNG